MRRILAVLTVLYAMSFFGCAHLEKQIQENNERIEALSRDGHALQGRLDDIESRVGEVETTAEELVKMQDTVEQLAHEKIVLESRIADMETKLAPKPVEVAKTPAQSSLKLKVLSGTGKLDTAKQMARKLEAAGYRIDRTGLAPSRNFTRNKVFYRENHKAGAEKLASEIGEGTVITPLTWDSIYDIIVVAK